MTTAEVERVMELIDIDKNGYIEYSEWMAAMVDKKNLLDENRLRAAFNAIDVDGSEMIELDEIKRILIVGEDVAESVWEDILNEIDSDGNGSVDF